MAKSPTTRKPDCDEQLWLRGADRHTTHEVGEGGIGPGAVVEHRVHHREVGEQIRLEAVRGRSLT